MTSTAILAASALLVFAHRVDMVGRRLRLPSVVLPILTGMALLPLLAGMVLPYAAGKEAHLSPLIMVLVVLATLPYASRPVPRTATRLPSGAAATPAGRCRHRRGRCGGTRW